MRLRYRVHSLYGRIVLHKVSRQSFLKQSLATGSLLAIGGCGGGARSITAAPPAPGAWAPTVTFIRRGLLEPAFERSFASAEKHFPSGSRAYYYSQYVVHDGLNTTIIPTSSKLTRTSLDIQFLDPNTKQIQSFPLTATVTLVPDAAERIVKPNRPIPRSIQAAVNSGEAYYAKVIDGGCPQVSDDGCDDEGDDSDDDSSGNDDSAPDDSGEGGINEYGSDSGLGGCSGGGSAQVVNGDIFAATNVCNAPGKQTIYVSYRVPAGYRTNVMVVMCVLAGSFNACYPFPNQVPGSSGTGTLMVPSSQYAVVSMSVYVGTNSTAVGGAYLNGCVCT